MEHLWASEKDKTSLTEIFPNDDWKKCRYKIKLKITGTSYANQASQASQASQAYPGPVKLRRGQSQTQTEGIELSQKLDTWITTGTFSFLHMVIIAQNIRVLKYLINNQKGEQGESMIIVDN